MAFTTSQLFLYIFGSIAAFVIFLFNLKKVRKAIWKTKSIMVILGSGGHTGEILIMISKLDFNKFTDCYFICAHNDTNSFDKAKETIQAEKFPKTQFHFIKIRRSRKHQRCFASCSYYSNNIFFINLKSIYQAIIFHVHLKFPLNNCFLFIKHCHKYFFRCHWQCI